MLGFVLCGAPVGCVRPGSSDGAVVVSNVAHRASERADPTTQASFSFLMGKGVERVGVQCGIANSVQPEWVALHDLVDSGAAERLWDVALHAATVEGRVLGIIGLVKLGRLSPDQGEGFLASMQGNVTSCSGCMIHSTPPTGFTGLASAPRPRRLPLEETGSPDPDSVPHTVGTDD